MPGSSGPPRRTVLLGALGACVTGCSRRAAPTPAPAADPDATLLGRLADAERALLARYAATVRRHPALGPRLRPLAAEHEAHLGALSVELRRPASASTPAVPGVPRTVAGALAALAGAERSAAQERIEMTIACSRERAPLLASMGAAEAAHAYLLTAAESP